MGIFNKKVSSMPTAPPREDFVQQRQETPKPVEVEQPKPQPEPKVEEVEEKEVEQEEDKVMYVPKSISQEDINNLVIENNFMLKKILSLAE